MINFNYISIDKRELFDNTMTVAADKDAATYFIGSNSSRVINSAQTNTTPYYDYDALIIVEGDTNNSPLLITHGKVIEITGGNNYESLLSALNSKADADVVNSIVAQVDTITENYTGSNKIWLVNNINSLPEGILNGDIVVKSSSITKNQIGVYTSEDFESYDSSYYTDVIYAGKEEIFGNFLLEDFYYGGLGNEHHLNNNQLGYVENRTLQTIIIESPFLMYNAFRIMGKYTCHYTNCGSVTYDEDRHLYVYTINANDFYNAIDNPLYTLHNIYISIIPAFITPHTCEEYMEGEDDSLWEETRNSFLNAGTIYTVYGIVSSPLEVYCYDGQLTQLYGNNIYEPVLTGEKLNAVNSGITSKLVNDIKNLSNTYLSKLDAVTLYLTKSSASSTYLSKSDAATLYLSREGYYADKEPRVVDSFGRIDDLVAVDNNSLCYIKDINKFVIIQYRETSIPATTSGTTKTITLANLTDDQKIELARSFDYAAYSEFYVFNIMYATGNGFCPLYSEDGTQCYLKPRRIVIEEDGSVSMYPDDTNIYDDNFTAINGKTIPSSNVRYIWLKNNINGQTFCGFYRSDVLKSQLCLSIDYRVLGSYSRDFEQYYNGIIQHFDKIDNAVDDIQTSIDDIQTSYAYVKKCEIRTENNVLINTNDPIPQLSGNEGLKETVQNINWNPSHDDDTEYENVSAIITDWFDIVAGVLYSISNYESFFPIDVCFIIRLRYTNNNGQIATKWYATKNINKSGYNNVVSEDAPLYGNITLYENYIINQNNVNSCKCCIAWIMRENNGERPVFNAAAIYSLNSISGFYSHDHRITLSSGDTCNLKKAVDATQFLNYKKEYKNDFELDRFRVQDSVVLENPSIYPSGYDHYFLINMGYMGVYGYSNDTSHNFDLANTTYDFRCFENESIYVILKINKCSDYEYSIYLPTSSDLEIQEVGDTLSYINSYNQENDKETIVCIQNNFIVFGSAEVQEQQEEIEEIEE